eukprot:CAMPEP_0206586250 /NCGR_PEP_ID=MMETSP0325_2-20121206/36905_1 /ASSEMBLY_ACC=CAM_ASM_000347 /TAXON_ID=2866 /ORGANISM="Crypthecodinium cohnii, Strain Seligo" /LENGTH=90 /DNA_ID=CAMNT_0054093961 /DNA_START=448 /DNA_END=721 /DNA_ORIENTATION=-
MTLFGSSFLAVAAEVGGLQGMDFESVLPLGSEMSLSVAMPARDSGRARARTGSAGGCCCCRAGAGGPEAAATAAPRSPLSLSNPSRRRFK